jgi:hypothetical protein
MSEVREDFMVSPVHHPVTPNQAENIFNQAPANQVPANQAPARTAQKPAARPQPVHDSVTLSRPVEADHDGDSK